jgi:hypothetical protein
MAVKQRLEDSTEDVRRLTRSVLEAIAQLRAADVRLHLAPRNSPARTEAEREVEGQVRYVRELVNRGPVSTPARATLCAPRLHNRPFGRA